MLRQRESRDPTIHIEHDTRSSRAEATRSFGLTRSRICKRAAAKKNDMFNPRLRLRFVGVHGGALHRFATSGFSFREIVSSYFTHSQTSFFFREHHLHKLFLFWSVAITVAVDGSLAPKNIPGKASVSSLQVMFYLFYPCLG